MRFLPVNSRALLVELDGLAQTLALFSSLQRDPLAGIDEIVPAARTLLIHIQPGVQTPSGIARALAGRCPCVHVESGDALGGGRVEIPVRYDGEDLAAVAQILGTTPEEVVRMHTGSDYTVAFTGFAPGFAYLSGGDTRLQVPRRSTPRTRVPAGSVALAGGFSAVYPDATPGGWQLLGSTEVRMWDLQRDPPALLQPGMRVRFVDIASEKIAVSDLPEKISDKNHIENQAVKAPDARFLSVRATGLQTLFQDGGRPGRAGQGVSAAGAMDQGAMRRANRLVGNAAGLPVLEALAGGLQLASSGHCVVAVTGASGPLTLSTADGRRWPVPRNQALALADGDVLALGEPGAGLRSYVALRGGFVVDPVLGSASTDTLAKVGPAALAVGQQLLAGAGPVAAVAEPDIALAPLPQAGDTVTLDVVLGPRTDWFTPEAVALLAAQRWQVTAQSNRVGLRLAGDTALARSPAHEGQELPSEGTALGAIQVPASGQPVLFLADHPLTGGYPVIGCVAPHHLDLAGQIPPGAWIRFNPLAPFAEIAG